MEDTAAQQVQAFIDQFLPQSLSREPSNRRFIPHSLLYDFEHLYDDVRFSAAALKACLEGYMALVPSVTAAIQALETDDTDISYFRGASLHRFGHMGASELVISYLYRVPDDDPDWNTFLTFVQEASLVQRLKDFLQFLDPTADLWSMDSCKRIYTIVDILSDLDKPQ